MKIFHINGSSFIKNIALLCVIFLSGCEIDPEPLRGSERGKYKVIDGDTVRLGALKVRLHGIDAPELTQQCNINNGQMWDCGQAAKAALEAHANASFWDCEGSGRTDKYGRSLAICRYGDVVVNDSLVRQGYALAYRHYSADYIEAEEEARATKRGLWGNNVYFINPWEYRKKRP